MEGNKNHGSTMVPTVITLKFETFKYLVIGEF